MKRFLEGNEILGDIEFIEPLKNKTEMHVKNAKTWTKDIIKEAKK